MGEEEIQCPLHQSSPSSFSGKYWMPYQPEKILLEGETCAFWTQVFQHTSSVLRTGGLQLAHIIYEGRCCEKLKWKWDGRATETDGREKLVTKPNNKYKQLVKHLSSLEVHCAFLFCFIQD